jgi:hypothetical protein
VSSATHRRRSEATMRHLPRSQRERLRVLVDGSIRFGTIEPRRRSRLLGAQGRKLPHFQPVLRLRLPASVLRAAVNQGNHTLTSSCSGNQKNDDQMGRAAWLVAVQRSRSGLEGARTQRISACLATQVLLRLLFPARPRRRTRWASGHLLPHTC